MVQQQTDNYIKLCMKSWLLCESCIHAEVNSPSPRYALINQWTACAKSCFAVVSRLVSDPDNLEDLPFKCMLHCRLCVDESDKYPEEEDIQMCSEICAICADTVKDLVVFVAN